VPTGERSFAIVSVERSCVPPPEDGPRFDVIRWVLPFLSRVASTFDVGVPGTVITRAIAARSSSSLPSDRHYACSEEAIESLRHPRARGGTARGVTREDAPSPMSGWSVCLRRLAASPVVSGIDKKKRQPRLRACVIHIRDRAQFAASSSHSTSLKSGPARVMASRRCGPDLAREVRRPSR